MVAVEKIEAFKECKFWRQCTGDERPEVKSIFDILYWYFHVLVKHAYIYIKYPKRWGKYSSINESKCDLLIIQLTKNQKDANFGIESEKYRYITASNDDATDIQIPWGRLAILTLARVTSFFCAIAFKRKLKNYGPWIEELARYSAGKIIANELYSRVKPTAVIVSNDHSGVSRAIIKKAKEKNIKIIYTQHAQIGNNFPKLNFNLSLLDGIQALDKYISSGTPNGIIAITGRRKISKIERRKNLIYRRNIGLCSNILDDLILWEKIIKILKVNNASIKVRSHPADRRKEAWKKISINNGVEFNEGSLGEYLSDVDILITGESGVALDAYAAGIPVITIKPTQLKSERMQDYYGYLKFGIATECTDIHHINELVDKIKLDELHFHNLGLFEAGLVTSPVMEKNDIIEKYISFLNNKIKFDDMIDGKVRSQYREVLFYTSEKYSKVISGYTNDVVFNKPQKLARY